MIAIESVQALPACLTSDVLDLIRAAIERGNDVQGLESLQDATEIFCPNAFGFHGIDFNEFLRPGSNAEQVKILEAFTVQGRNARAVNFIPEKLRKRPSGPRGLVVGDDQPSGKPHVKDAFAQEINQLLADAKHALADEDLVVIISESSPPLELARKFSRIELPDDWTFLRVGWVIPRKMAGWMGAALGVLHSVVPFSSLKNESNIDAIVMPSIALRNSHFDGEQTAVYIRRAGLPTIVLTSGSYPGGALKKLLMTLAISKAHAMGGMVFHAANAKFVSPGGHETSVMLIARSGAGKTELISEITFDEEGKAVVTVWYNGECHIKDVPAVDIFACADDILVALPMFQDEGGKLVVFNFERGLFDRIDLYKKPGDLPHVDRLLSGKVTHPDTGEVCVPIAVNLSFLPGEFCCGDRHFAEARTVGNGYVAELNTNPRLIYPAWGNQNSLQTVIPMDIVAYGMALNPSSREEPNGAILSLWHEVSPMEFFLTAYVGPCMAKSVSVDGSASAPMITDPYGTTSPFSLLTRVEAAIDLFRHICRASNTRFVIWPVKHVGSRPVGFFPAQLAVRAYALAKDGLARWTKTRARCPFLGTIPRHLLIGENGFPIGLEDVSEQSAMGPDGYDACVTYLRELYLTELEPLLQNLVEAIEGGAIASADLPFAALIIDGIQAFKRSDVHQADFEALSAAMKQVIV